MKNRNEILRRMVFAALMVGMEVVLSRFLSINTPVVRIGFGFVPIALCGLLYGPLWAAGAGAAADLLGALLFPSGPYFPGFTLTAALAGCAYGLFLHKWQASAALRAVCAAVWVAAPLNLGLNTLWLHLLYNKGFLALVPTRVLQCAIMLPVQAAVMWLLAARLAPALRGKT